MAVNRTASRAALMSKYPEESAHLMSLLTRHPFLIAFALLAVAMQMVLFMATRAIALAPSQYLFVAASTVALAALCVWIVTWE